jgi:hypothetical protein
MIMAMKTYASQHNFERGRTRAIGSGRDDKLLSRLAKSTFAGIRRGPVSGTCIDVLGEDAESD